MWSNWHFGEEIPKRREELFYGVIGSADIRLQIVQALLHSSVSLEG